MYRSARILEAIATVTTVSGPTAPMADAGLRLGSPPRTALARPLGLGGPGGRDAFGDLFQIAVTAAWAKERDGEPIRNPRASRRVARSHHRSRRVRDRGGRARPMKDATAGLMGVGTPDSERNRRAPAPTTRASVRQRSARRETGKSKKVSGNGSSRSV
jgi:hypothetical protein